MRERVTKTREEFKSEKLIYSMFPYQIQIKNGDYPYETSFQAAKDSDC